MTAFIDVRGRAGHSARGADHRPAGRVGGPILIFSAFYVSFLLVLWIPIAQWMPASLESLTISRALFGFTPPKKIVILYMTGLAGIWIGYLLVRPLAVVIAPVRLSPSEKPSLGPWWCTAFVVVVAAFALQLYLVGTIPLFNIGSRWSLSAKLIAVISLSIALATGAIAQWGWCRRTWWIVGCTLLGLSAFGTRTLPLALVVAALCVTALFSALHVVVRALLWAVAGVMFVMLTVGVITKTGIYADEQGYQASKAVGLLQSDSIGTFSNLTQVVAVTDLSGQTLHGRLLHDSALKLVPGAGGSDYSNFQLGALIGGRTDVVINGSTIDRSVSLSTTFVGPPYADNGWTGVIAFSLAVGVFWAVFEEAALRRRWFAGFFGYWLAEIFVAVYSGGYNPNLFLVTLLCVAFSLTIPGSHRQVHDLEGPELCQ